MYSSGEVALPLTPRIVVVGAGMGGLAAAALLSARGLDVVVVERAAAPGGKLRRVQVGDAAIDVGPTVLTLREVFEALFTEAGGALEDAVSMERDDVLARHVWPDGARLDLHADPARSAEAIGDFAGASEARAFQDFMRRARETFETLDTAFIRDAAPSMAGLMMKAGVGRLSRIDPYQTYWRFLERSFGDPRLRQLFGRYATYVGCSPFEAPATLMLIAHVEQMGVWRVAGGLARLPDALAGLAARNGAELRYGAEVTEIVVEHGCAAGVRLAGGEVVTADAVVYDGDSGVLGAGGLGARAAKACPAIAPDARSFSAFTLAMTAEVSGVSLAHHTVAFSPDSAAEFRDLGQGRVPADASLYVCAQDRGGADAPAGPERLFMILNAPAKGDAGYPDDAESERCEAMARRNLARCGIEVRSLATERIGPRDFEALAPGTGGALYGQAGHGWMAAFKRPATRSKVAGLYLAGGSVHPGPGLPMAVLSGRAAADCATADLSAQRSRTGWTSTRR